MFNYSDYFDSVRDGADMRMRDRLNYDAERMNNPSRYELRNYMNGWNDERGDYDTPNSLFKDKLDKQWQDTKDRENIQGWQILGHFIEKAHLTVHSYYNKNHYLYF